MDQWYYLDGDKSVGPFDVDVVRQLLRAGVIGEASLVARVGDNEWHPASSLVGGDEPIVLKTAATPPVAQPASPSFTVGPLRPLALATGAFLGFFLIQLLLVRNFFGRTNLDPGLEFSWERALAKYSIPIIGLAILAIAIATVDWFRRQRVRDGKKSAAWMWSLVVLWLVAVGVCKWANDGSTHATGYLKLTAMYMQGAGGSAVLYVAALALVVVATVAVAGSLAARRVITTATASGALPPVATLVAAALARLVVMLALIAAVFPAFVAITKWPPKVNTDRRTIDLIVRAVGDYAASEKENLGKAWYDLLRMDGTRTDQETWFGDSSGIIDGNLIRLLGGHLDESLRDREVILDTWGRPVRAALDGTGDGMIRFGIEEQMQARVMVWTVGWNGVDEGGAGDDVMVVVGGI